MATVTKRKKAEMPAAEKALGEQIKKLSEVEKPSDAQKAQLKDARSKLGTLRFVRIANKRIPKALKAVAGVSNLAGASYTKTPAQVTAIVAALTAAVAEVERKLSGSKAETGGFSLPV